MRSLQALSYYFGEEHRGSFATLDIVVSNTMTDAIELLSTRKSVKAVELKAPGPSAGEVDKLLTIACRVPDHGKLTPWRFIVFEGDARLAAGAAIAAAFRAKNPDAKPEHVEFQRKRLAASCPCPAGYRRGQSRRPPRENSGMGAGALRRSRCHEPCPRRARPRIWGELDHRVVRLRSRCARCAWPGTARAHSRICSHRNAVGTGYRSAAAAIERDRHSILCLAWRDARSGAGPVPGRYHRHLRKIRRDF